MGENEQVLKQMSESVQEIAPEQAPKQVQVKAASLSSLYERSLVVAHAKAHMSSLRIFVLSLLAGMMIATGASFMLLVKCDSSLGFAQSQILGGICFSLGLLCVIVSGAELFTGNMLMVQAALEKRITVKLLLKNWFLVYLGNLIGSLIMVALVLLAGMAFLNNASFGNTAIEIAFNKISLSPSTIFFRGILCNWLVCLAVWMGFAGHNVIDKVFTSVFPVMAFVACGFEHCVANMFFLPLGVMSYAVYGYSGTNSAIMLLQGLSLNGTILNIAVATLGNMVGGALLVGISYFFAYGRHKNCSNKD